MRVHACPETFLKDPAAFKQNLDTFVDIAHSLDIGVMPVLFNPGDVIGKLSYKNETLYLNTIVESVAAHPALLGWDLCNECYFKNASDKNNEALKQVAAAVKGDAEKSGKFTTTGMGDYGRWTNELQQLKIVTVVSFHSYNGNQTDMSANIDWLRGQAKHANRTVGFASEIMNRPWDPVCGDLAVLRNQKLGWFVWELMQSHSGWAGPRCPGCPSYQGLLWPNGTAYNPEEVECIANFATPEKQTVRWVPVATAVPTSTPHVQASLSFSPNWQIVSAGRSFLPWDNKDFWGQAAAEIYADAKEPGSDLGSGGAGAADTITLRFVGVRVEMYQQRGPTGGRVQITVDGAAKSVLDTHASSQTLTRDLLIDGLDPKVEHTLTVTLIPKDAGAGTPIAVAAKNKSALVSISGFDVWSA